MASRSSSSQDSYSTTIGKILNASNINPDQPMVNVLGFAKTFNDADIPVVRKEDERRNSCVLFPTPVIKNGLQRVLHPMLNSDKTGMAMAIIRHLRTGFNQFSRELHTLHLAGELKAYDSHEELLEAITKGEAVLGRLRGKWGQNGGASNFAYTTASGIINGIDLLKQMEVWRKDNHCNTLFFNSILDFESSTDVRGMLEGDSAATQCKRLYSDAGGGLEATPRSREEFEGSADQKKMLLNPDGLSANRNPIWWRRTKSDGSKEWLNPVTCYICETYLYATADGLENNMQCEHFAPFLEAQLLWLLKIPSKISFTGSTDQARATKFLNREYGPVCRLCNCNPHKGGKNILQLNTSVTGNGEATNPFEINKETITAIANDSVKNPKNTLLGVDPTNGRPKTASFDQTLKTQIRARVLNRAARTSRCQKVFQPLMNYVNRDLQGKTPQDIVDTMLIRYFYYFNNTTCRKLFSTLVDGEDIDKKIQKVENLKDEIRQKDKETMDIKTELAKICANIKTLIPPKKITLKGIMNKAGKIIKRRSSRVKALQKAQKEAITNLKNVLEYYITQVNQGAKNLKSAIDKFENDWRATISNASRLTALATEERQKTQKQQFIQAVADLNGEYKKLNTLFEAAFARRKQAAADGIFMTGGRLLYGVGGTVGDSMLSLEIFYRYSRYFLKVIHPKFKDIVRAIDIGADYAYTFYSSLSDNLEMETPPTQWKGYENQVVKLSRPRGDLTTLTVRVNISHFLSRPGFNVDTLFDNMTIMAKIKQFEEGEVAAAEQNVENAVRNARENQLRMTEGKSLSRKIILNKTQKDQLELFEYFYYLIYNVFFPKLLGLQSEEDLDHLYSYHTIYKFCHNNIDRLRFLEEGKRVRPSCWLSRVIGKALDEAICMFTFVCTKTFRIEHPRVTSQNMTAMRMADLDLRLRYNKLLEPEFLPREDIEVLDFTKPTPPSSPASSATGSRTAFGSTITLPVRRPGVSQATTESMRIGAMGRFRAERTHLKAEAEKRAHQEEAARISSMALRQAKKKASGNKKSQRQSNIPQGFQKQSQRQIQLTPEEKALQARLRAERKEREKKRKKAAAAERARVQAIKQEQIRQKRIAGQQRRREKEAKDKQARLEEELKQLELEARTGSLSHAPFASSTQPQPPVVPSRRNLPRINPPLRKSVTPEDLRKKLAEAKRVTTIRQPPKDAPRRQQHPSGKGRAKRRAPGTEKGKTRTSRSGDKDLRKAIKQTKRALELDRQAVRDLPYGGSRKKRRKKKKTIRKKKKKTRRKNKRKKKTKRRRRKRKKTRRRL